MEMNPDEIITRYRQAKNPNAQRSILADLNCCTVCVIDAILHNAGIETMQRRAKRKRPGKINDAKAFELYRSGANDETIGKACEVSASTARRWRGKHDLPANFRPQGRRTEL